jgi:SAM-dependent methyltransferase
MTLNIYEVPRAIKNEKNFPFWFSLLNEAKIIVDLEKLNLVMDFGCGGGGFLKLFNNFIQNKKLIGVEIDGSALKKCQAEKKENFSFLGYDDFHQINKETIDLVFSQEVLYTLTDISGHAEDMYRVLCAGGYYMATMGCHVENPTWLYRRDRIINSEKYPVHDYLLGDVARIFFDAGFRVYLKKLPAYAPFCFDLDDNSEFKNISDLIESSENQKMLFILMKPKHGK